MTDAEILYQSAKAKRTECLREVGILNAKAEVHKEYMDSLERIIESERKADEA